MLVQRKELDFEGENIYVGIDVHLRSWHISIYTADLHYKTFNGPSSPESLKDYRSSYYAWKKHPRGKRTLFREELESAIEEVYFDAEGRHGSPRIREECL